MPAPRQPADLSPVCGCPAPAAIPLFLLQDVGRALVAGEQVRRPPPSRRKPAAPSRAPAAGPDRPRRPARTPRRSGRGGRPARAAGPSGGRRRNRALRRGAIEPMRGIGVDALPARLASDPRIAWSGRRSPLPMISSIDASAARRSANGSFDPVGFIADAEEGAKRVQLVRQADRNRHRRGRHLVALPDRLVMIADGVGDGVGLALRARRDSRRSRPAARGTRRPCR